MSGAPGRVIPLVLTLCLLPALLPPEPCLAAHTYRLRPDRLPFVLEPDPSFVMTLENERERFRRPPVVVADLDGDGSEELVRTQRMAVTIGAWQGERVQVTWQQTLPPEYTWRQPCAGLSANHDLDRDGRPEIVIVSERQDGAEWHLWVLDPVERRIEAEMSLPVGPDLRADGRWDGAYAVLGSIDVPGHERPAVVLACHVGFDLWGRGVLAVDPVAGTILWRRPFGPDPLQSESALVDLDGDGRLEIAVATRGTDNREGALVEGHSDDSTMVYVLEADGTRAWCRSLVPHPGVTSLAAGDLDGDGRLEIVTASWSAAPEGQLAVWDGATGALLAEQRSQVGLRGCCLVPLSGAGGKAIVVGALEPRLRRYRYAAGRLSLENELVVPAESVVGMTADLLPTGDPQLVCNVHLRGLAILACDLKPLAFLSSSEVRYLTPEYALRGPQGSLLLQPVLDAPALRLRPRPASVTALPAPVPAVAAVLTLGFAGWWLRRRAVVNAARAGSNPDLRPELRLQLLGRLQLGNHGKIGALRALRRLPWILEGMASLPTVGPEVEQRAQATLAEIRDARPRLEAILALASNCGIEEGLIALCRGPLDELAKAVGPSTGGEGAEHPQDLIGRLPAIGRAVQEAEQGFERLRRQVESWFVADLGQVVTRVLAAHAEALRGVAIEVTGAGSSGGEASGGLGRGPDCQVEAGHLEFIVDNLVGNAARALREAADRRLAIRLTRAGTMVSCEVEDSGCGIARDRWESVLGGRDSTRRGGGLGLRRSRELVKLYEGSLEIVASEPGRGTVMRLLMPGTLVEEGAHPT